MFESNLEDNSRLSGSKRIAVPIAGDDQESKKVASAFFDSIGYDVVDAGGLRDSWQFEQGQEAYSARLTKEELAEMLGG